MAQVQVRQAVPSVWRNHNYVILFFSGALVTLGMKVYELTLPLILYELANHSPVAMSTMRAIEFLPNLLLALFIGVFVDRVNKKRWVLGTVLWQTMLLLVLYGLHVAGQEHIAVYYVAGFLLMAGGYAYGNGRVSIVKHALPTEMLTSANASFSFISTLIGILGPAISGFLLMLADLHDGLLVTGVALALAYLITTLLRTEEQAKPRQAGTFWQDLRDGWQELRRNKALWSITMLVIFLNATAGMVDAMIVFFAKDQLHLDNATLGVVLGVAGIGGLLGSMLVGWCRKRFQTGHLLGATIVLLGVSYAMTYFAHGVAMLAASQLFAGIFATIQSVCIWTFRQESTPADMIGRVSGLTGSIFKLGMVFTIFGSGWMTDWFGGPAPVFLTAALCNAVVFAVYRCLPLWKLK